MTNYWFGRVGSGKEGRPWASSFIGELFKDLSPKKDSEESFYVIYLDGVKGLGQVV